LSTGQSTRWLGTSALVVAPVLALAVTVGTAAAARQSGCSSEYAYAGLQSPAAVDGVEATITATSPPKVAWGHIGGWIGVGGPGQGPNGTDAWVQVGLSSFADDKGSRIYYEIALPRAKPRYAEVDTNVVVGESHRLAIKELPGAHGWWRVLVDDRPVSVAVRMPASHGHWKAQAFGESWNGGQNVCNVFDYTFAGVQVAQAGSWLPLTGATLVQDPDYRIRRLPNAGFRARFIG
jgi:hypothetical protein